MRRNKVTIGFQLGAQSSEIQCDYRRVRKCKVAVSSRRDEIEMVVANRLNHMPIEDLERLFEEALDDAEFSGLPHRGTSDRSFWRQGLDRLKKEIATQEPTASATAVFAASQAVDWAHAIGLDLTDYNVPIAILVALAVNAVWAQRSDSDRGARRDDQHDQ